MYPFARPENPSKKIAAKRSVVRKLKETKTPVGVKMGLQSAAKRCVWGGCRREERISLPWTERGVVRELIDFPSP
jgi:hypothetical protein